MIELNTKAEKLALHVTSLPAFRGVALGSIKQQVAQMLALIGRIKDIFATYTNHDISHVNAMLTHLDWLIPPDTQEVMTSADWLLIILSIYLHDLGMLVTPEEFDSRMENELYKGFLKKINSDPQSIDYLNRAKRMEEKQREIFFFQEFIRETHSKRINEWITGRHSRHWGSAAKPIPEAVTRLMQPLPARFRENLGLVCESHHLDNLNRLDIYPLCQRYGNDSNEMANVQYAALILRTVDLLHVTKDRTPSVNYNIINFSDPKSVEEWDKQKETFAVRHAGRVFDPNDESTHTIIVSADFTEERPFFALTEYLSWADAEIKKSRRWNEQSRLHKDGEQFDFPWQGVRGDLRVEGNQPQPMRFEFDRGRLLNLLVGHAIYNDATVAVRELLQNAIDAVRFQHYLDNANTETSVPMGKVTVTWHEDSRKLVVEDTGTGMDLDLIKHHLMRVGCSFYDTPQFAAEHKTFTSISRFGIGILTCFMISDDIEIVTIKGQFGYRIRMSSVHADYLLRELPQGDSKLLGIEPHGTRVSLVIRDGVNLSDRSIEEILRYWVILPECSVYYKDMKKGPISIGFESPIAALEYYYKAAKKGQPKTWQNTTFVSKQQSLNAGICEMGIAVESAWFPEKSFARPPQSSPPSVCIEGIRVANSLPGFDSRQKANRLSALVSVRGVRELRTTVSRSGLEVDEQYIILGRACAEMLMEHVQDEIHRLSDAEGNPLSRASTGANWLSQDLIREATLDSIEKYLINLRRELPMIVIERMEPENITPVVKRDLISPKTLAEEEHFWTIESRLVDSLGIISRDLGRELSLNQFLATLAPEHVQIGHTPILPDANLFINDLKDSHHPSLVEFSHLDQQTAIKWTRGIDKMRKVRNSVFKDDVFILALREEMIRRKDVGLPRQDIAPQSNVYIGDIVGDLHDVNIVSTRTIMVLSKESEQAKIYKIICDAVDCAAEQKNAHHLVLFIQLASLYEILLKNLTRYKYNHEYAYSYALRTEHINPREADAIWKELVTEVNALLSDVDIEEYIPESIDFIKSEKSFNASDYWRDWHRDNNR